MNWFAITGWAIVLFLGNTVLRAAATIDQKPKERLVNEAFGIIAISLIATWIVVSIQRCP